MGEKGSCFSAVKKVVACKNKKKDKKSRKWFRKQSHVTTTVDSSPVPPIEQNKAIEAKNEASDGAVAGLTAAACDSGKSKEEFAAISIQAAFRGYLARRALRALRGLVRLKTVIQGDSVKRQGASILRYMQTLARLQSQIRTTRITTLEEKNHKEQEKLIASQSGDNWNDSTQSKEQVEANMQRKKEAAMRREKALAYAYTHQICTDQKNSNQGWSWLERWMASHPWEDKSVLDKEHDSTVHEIAKIPTNHEQSQAPKCQSPRTPRPKTRRIRPASPRRSNVDDDSRSVVSATSDRGRRHSVSSIRDDESVASFQTVPSYMAPTESVRAKSRLPSPLGFEKNGTYEKGTSCNSAKKRLSFSTSPRCPRRHSDPQISNE